MSLPDTTPDTPTHQPWKLLQVVLVICTTLFILTIMFMIAASFSDAAITAWFDRYGLILLLSEAGCIIIVGLRAIITDPPPPPDLSLLFPPDTSQTHDDHSGSNLQSSISEATNSEMAAPSHSLGAPS